ncbi:MAG: hypothetical protein JW869_01475 [Candidatus Omnitrophica bacterium]|nr:hypothetical protein [Candidatus Omnitrophota bacterium]
MNCLYRFIMAVVILSLLGMSMGFTDEPQQGTIIPCEECVVLYPQKYKDNSQICPVCGGAKEHFQPARFMNHELAEIEARELELKIERALIDTLEDAQRQTVSLDTLNWIRELYMEKLIFYLVHGQFELEPVKETIYRLDGLINQ